MILREDGEHIRCPVDIHQRASCAKNLGMIRNDIFCDSAHLFKGLLETFFFKVTVGCRSRFGNGKINQLIEGHVDFMPNIDRFLLDESFFPDDLILLDTGKKFTPSDDALYRMYVQKYEKFILRSFEAGGKESDLNNESIRFIIKGLGYDWYSLVESPVSLKHHLASRDLD